jgi:hypothetical protein
MKQVRPAEFRYVACAPVSKGGEMMGMSDYEILTIVISIISLLMVAYTLGKHK